MIEKSVETGAEAICSQTLVSSPQIAHLFTVQIPTTGHEGLFQAENPMISLQLDREAPFLFAPLFTQCTGS